MNQLLRLAAVGGFVLVVILLIPLGLAQHDTNLTGPINLLLFLVALALYLLPAALAMYRDCKSMVWIALLDIALGWTIIGWFAALGWAVKGEAAAVPAAPAPPARPATGH